MWTVLFVCLLQYSYVRSEQFRHRRSQGIFNFSSPSTTGNSSSCGNQLQLLGQATMELRDQMDHMINKNEELVARMAKLVKTCTCQTECEYEGQTYLDGEVWHPSPCITCTCLAKEAHCMESHDIQGCGFQCDSQTCLNGGECHRGPTSDSFACDCPSGFSGPFCEQSVGRCVGHEPQGLCVHNDPIWYYNPSSQQCMTSESGCYDPAAVFPSASACYTSCTQGTCCYRSKDPEGNVETEMVCQDGSLMNCQSLCHDGEVEVVGFFPGTYCTTGDCKVQEPKACHTGNALHWPGSTFTFGCEECECQIDHLACKCSRMSVRREIRELNPSEWQRFRSAVSAIHGANSSGVWESFRDLYATYIMHSHSPSYFLLWHRLFLRYMERHLQQIDCTIAIPYFDFTLDAGNLSASVAWHPHRFGGVGSDSGDCVLDHSLNGARSTPWTSCTIRHFKTNIRIPTMVEVAIALATDDFGEFTAYMQNIAGYLHSFIGGGMEAAGSPYDPVFYSIHAYIDMLFWRWQRRHGHRIAEELELNSIDTLMMPFNTAPKFAVDSENSLCVTYGLQIEHDSSRHPGGDSSRHPGGDSSRHPGGDSSRHPGGDSSRYPGQNIPQWESENHHYTTVASQSPCFSGDAEECPTDDRAALNIAQLIQELLYSQSEDFLRTLPRTCPSLNDLPPNYVNQVWNEPISNMTGFTTFQKVNVQSAWCERFCFTADLFIPDDSQKSCSGNKPAVCDMSVLSSCPYYPHALCKLSLCGNCTATCYVDGQELECGKTTDNCQPNPCKNNGRCQPSKWPTLPHLVSCQCPPGFEGPYCERISSQRCYLPVDHGEAIEGCGEAVQRWHFDLHTKDCQAFWYSGCLGNANNFASYYDCRVACMVGACCWRIPLHSVQIHGYSEEGYDRYGFNFDGASRQNEKRTLSNGFGGDIGVYGSSGFDYQGYDKIGFNKQTIDRFGYNRRGYHHVTGFNLTGYNTIGDYDGIIDFDEMGYDSDGFNRAGLNCHDYSRDGWDYYGLCAGWNYDCRAMTLRECQKIEEEFPHLRQEVISFSPGKKCEDVHCELLCGCDFLGQSYPVGSQVPMGCGMCECRHSGRMICPCSTTYMRKEIRDLSMEELRRYQNAIKRLHLEDAYPSRWQNLTHMYERHFPQSRGGPHFLPWHRFFLRLVEMELQTVDCAITIPYFDWTMDSGELDTSVVWQANHFGGNGDSRMGNCVPNHPFKNYHPYFWSPCLRRNFNTSVHLPDVVNIEMILRETNYDDFRIQLESISSLFHLFVGGHMTTPECAYDPIFLSHYAFIDKLWYDWEHNKHHSEPQYPAEARFLPMVPFGVTPDDVLLSELQMCVNYVDITDGAPCVKGSNEVDSTQLPSFLTPHTYDAEGFNVEGYHRSGYDRMGWNRNGFSRESFNRDGFDSFGYDRNGFNRYGFDVNGCNSNGFCTDSRDRHHQYQSPERNFNQYGYSNVGLDFHGYDTYGFNPRGFDKENCSYYFDGPFYPIFMKQAKQQLNHLTEEELVNIKRTCEQVSILPEWWMETTWLSRHEQIGIIREYEDIRINEHPVVGPDVYSLPVHFNEWLPPIPDERFCFQLHHHSGCSLDQPPVPCPLQNCDAAMCPTQPNTRCRNFGCGSCDATFLDLSTRQPTSCNTLDCTSMNGTIREENEVWEETLCETCMCQEGHVVCSTIDCEEEMMCQHPIQVPSACCPICEGCEYEEMSYANGAEFISPSNPCLQCSCHNGTVLCSPVICPPMNPCRQQALVTLSGQCCPVCTMCGSHKNGSTWTESRCHDCSCMDGKVDCRTIDCPSVTCHHPGRSEEECCRHCDDCEYDGLNVRNGEVFHPDPCNECRCQDGNVRCRVTTCPPPRCLHPVAVSGQCCPECPTECQYDGQKYENGKHFAPKFSPCMNCSCQNSLVRCQPMICPVPNPPCRSPIVSPGNCCPICPKCYSQNKEFENGDRWMDPSDPCQTCVCTDGLVICSKKETCERDCTHGTKSEGECCSPCTDCMYEGRLVMNRMQFSPPEDPCTRCACISGSISCNREACTTLPCRRTEMRPGECCPVCRGCIDSTGRRLEHGRQWVHPSDLCQMCTCQEGISRCERKSCDMQCSHPIRRPESCCPDCHGCQYEGQIYHINDEIPSGDPCTKCICYNGNMECESVKCPPVTCDRPKTMIGQCCPVCNECKALGVRYKNGDNFRPSNNPCYNCTCEMGVIQCRNTEEFCNPQCSNPARVPGQCCPICDGCDYQRRNYRNGQKFTPEETDPCQQCECLNGNVKCSKQQCPPLQCSNPVQPADQCCPECPPFCTVGRVIHEEGDVWPHDEDSCQVCTCKFSTVRCQRRSCPPAACPHPAAPYGECCPQCQHCEFTRRLYRSGQKFTHIEDPCQQCVCQNGTVSCVTTPCGPMPCSKPKPVDGECCPICPPDPGCQYQGKEFQPWQTFTDLQDPCSECVCAEGMVTCHQRPCPEIDCPNPLSSRCCTTCDGCSYGGKNYVNHQLFVDPQNPCRKCRCDNGHVSCQQQPCPKVVCRHPMMTEGECCPLCKDCAYGNQLYGNGEIFPDPLNHCIECHCQYPTVHCQPRSCPETSCSHPITENCCKHCSGCDFHGTIFESGKTFTNPNNPCEHCKCQKGNVNCKKQFCPPVSCSHPVEGKCCQECTSDCWYSGSLYTHWQVFPNPQDPCQECVCRKGNVTCKVKKCPPLKCRHPAKTQCCPNCNDCWYKGQVIRNGEKISDPSDVCKECQCKDGNVKCGPLPCPVIHCTNPVMEGCCPVCHLGCLFNGTIHNFGAEFDHPGDPCSECACMHGSVHCALKPCEPVSCPNPIEGQCCPECPTYCIHGGEKRLNGTTFSDHTDSCNDCKCVEGAIQCHKRPCSPIACSHPAPGKCCMECKDCQYLGKVYNEGESFASPTDTCKECHCRGGEVTCRPPDCESLSCPVQIVLEDQCCPVCVTTCQVENKIYEDGETFIPASDKCQRCTCVEGQVVCKPAVCPQCLHPIHDPAHCCPSCDGCSYEMRKYDNQERFTSPGNPCEECICKNGTVTCHRLACSPPTCAQPVLPEGQCCPICRGCIISGIKFEEGKVFTNPENPCQDCQCIEGHAVCEEQTCHLQCSHPMPDPCCPICDGCLFESETYRNEEKFHPDLCRTCLCKDGNVECVTEICPKLECQLRSRLPGQCCEVCRGCVYEGTEYADGANWVSTANPCLSCQCVGGTITCTELQCVLPCAKPRPVPGKCCPVCPECEINGKVFQSGEIFTPDDSPCDTCTCDSGQLICVHKQCPTLADCPRESVRPPGPGECCPTCAGFGTNCTRDQIGQVFQPSPDPCFVCQCGEDFRWVCSREVCPSFFCPKEEVLLVEGECCPKCKVCKTEVDEEFRQHGSSWASTVDPCLTCLCEYGSVQCSKTSCPEIECLPGEMPHSLSGECCDVCVPADHLACNYAGHHFEVGQSWYPEPCIRCLCTEGRVNCHSERCVPLSCPSDEIPSVDPGRCCPKCIPRPATCVAFGDPHYRTFDGAIVHFQGTCRYVLAADCYTQLFTVLVENNDRGFRSVSWTDRVVLVLKNITVDLRKGPTIFVKGKLINNLPYFDDPVLYIENTGSSVLVTTDVGVKVLWNGESYVEVIVSGVFRERTCGLCGNFNNFPEDDMRLPSGQIVSSATRFGNSWKNRGAQPASCTEAKDLDPCVQGGYRARKTANTKCSVLKGPLFAPCHPFIRPEPYFASCVYDVCACSENDDCLCDILSAYSQECSKAGVILSWRSAGLCALGCRLEEGFVFDECGPPCPRTCENRDLSMDILAAQCFKPCVPGCQCTADKVLHNGHCIDLKDCP